MPQTYLRENLYRIIIRSYVDKSPVDIINEAVEEKLRRDGHLEKKKA